MSISSTRIFNRKAIYIFTFMINESNKEIINFIFFKRTTIGYIFRFKEIPNFTTSTIRNNRRINKIFYTTKFSKLNKINFNFLKKKFTINTCEEISNIFIFRSNNITSKKITIKRCLSFIFSISGITYNYIIYRNRFHLRYSGKIKSTIDRWNINFKSFITFFCSRAFIYYS